MAIKARSSRLGALLATGLAVNAAWGLGTAILFRVMARSR
jgi:hypothetical protein